MIDWQKARPAALAAPFYTKSSSFWKLHFDVFKQLHFGAASSVLEAQFWKLHFGAAIAVLELAASKWSFLESQGFVRKSCSSTSKIEIVPQFLRIDPHFV